LHQVPDDSLVREAKLIRRLEDIVYPQEDGSGADHVVAQEQDTLSNEDIIKLQILTIAALEKDKIEKRERSMNVLRAMKSQGREMKEQGDFLIKMVEEEVDRHYLAD
jgi:hypothetical protein